MDSIWIKVMLFFTIGVIFAGCSNSNIEEAKSKIETKQAKNTVWDNGTWDDTTWK